jgi:hypothetical protein
MATPPHANGRRPSDGVGHVPAPRASGCGMRRRLAAHCSIWRVSVSIPLFEAELAAFARQAGAGPKKKIVLMLDRAGWHTSLRVRVPDHVYLHSSRPIPQNCSRLSTSGRSPMRR